MNDLLIQPFQLAWATGALSHGPLIRKTTLLGDLSAIFTDGDATQLFPDRPAYAVDMFDTPGGEGELYVGVTHLYPGKVGNEYFMTRGHFHQRREQGEVYFGLQGEGQLLMQNQQGQAWTEPVFAGSVHIIPGYTAHRLINTGSQTLSALAVWPSTAGHDYTSLPHGFALRVIEEAGKVRIMAVKHG
ncbi:glucose-6-phosphate isomerase family protein [Atlantibacter subterraneus]|uniref:glucose-6-phosphate isomerase family protein n=1 Tax=Atlantibacter subterraneus TaxID=255519 RepID=UPI0028AA4920|nr:glucose-6-phosphate isomerase family protein [Atlantibacter subterranea]